MFIILTIPLKLPTSAKYTKPLKKKPVRITSSRPNELHLLNLPVSQVEHVVADFPVDRRTLTVFVHIDDSYYFGFAFRILPFVLAVSHAPGGGYRPFPIDVGKF